MSCMKIKRSRMTLHTTTRSFLFHFATRVKVTQNIKSLHVDKGTFLLFFFSNPIYFLAPVSPNYQNLFESPRLAVLLLRIEELAGGRGLSALSRMHAYAQQQNLRELCFLLSDRLLGACGADKERRCALRLVDAHVPELHACKDYGPNRGISQNNWPH